jgi:NitT/TauT family transport system substrate-binding protein
MAALGLFCASVVLAGASSAAFAKDAVNISNFSWPGYSWLFVAKEKNLAPDLEINIEIIEDPLQSFSMIASGRLDATLSTAEFGPIATEQEMPFKTVAFNNFSCGIDRIILHPDITDPQQLKGQRVAVMEGGLSHIFMGLWLERNGIAYDEVEFVNLIMDDAAAAMIGGDVMAGEFWEPYGSQVLDNLEGSWAAASTDEPFFAQTGLLSDAIFFSDDLINNRRDVALKLMKALFDGQAYWQANPAEANQIIAEQMQFSLEDVESILGANAGYCAHGLYVGSFQTAARFCGAVAGDPGHQMVNGGIADSWRLINEWWLKLGLMESEVAPESGLDCSLLVELAEAGYEGAEIPQEAFD